MTGSLTNAFGPRIEREQQERSDFDALMDQLERDARAGRLPPEIAGGWTVFLAAEKQGVPLRAVTDRLTNALRALAQAKNVIPAPEDADCRL